MLDLLFQAERELPYLLLDESGWCGMYADSEKPHLKRIWRPWRENRLYCHDFSECSEKEEFPHPHPWKMAVGIRAGRCQMRLGVGTTPLVAPPMTTSIILNPGDSYEMLGEHDWHAIRPLMRRYLSVMVTGPVVYPANKSRGNKPSRDLTQAEMRHAMETFRVLYPLS